MPEQDSPKPTYERIGEVAVILLLTSLIGKVAGVLQEDFGLKMFFVGLGLFAIFAITSLCVAVKKLFKR